MAVTDKTIPTLSNSSRANGTRKHPAGRAARCARRLFCESCGKLAAGHADRLLFVLWAAAEAEYRHEQVWNATSTSSAASCIPIVFSQATSQEQDWSLQKSSQMNDAYRTLKDPIARTEYLLKLEGVQMEEQSKQATEKARQSGETKKQVVPPDLLEEVFELNMQLEEARMNKKMGEIDENLDARPAADEDRAWKGSIGALDRRTEALLERVGCADRSRQRATRMPCRSRNGGRFATRWWTC